MFCAPGDKVSRPHDELRRGMHAGPNFDRRSGISTEFFRIFWSKF
jgi:hypothetical protein